MNAPWKPAGVAHREHLHREGVVLRGEGVEQVGGAHLGRPAPLRHLLGADDDETGVAGEPLEHAGLLSTSVLLVDGLPADAEHVRDLLPRPTGRPGAVDLGPLEVLEQPPQGAYGAEPGPRVRGGGCVGQLSQLGHGVNCS